MSEGGIRGGAWLGGASALVLALAGYGWWSFSGRDLTPAPAPEPKLAMPEAVTEPAVAPALAVEPAPEIVPEPVLAQETSPEVVAPEPEPAPVLAEDVQPDPEPAPVARYDALRVTPEGALTLAGTVAPGAQVELLLEGAVIETVTPNATGAFAALVDIDPSAEPRALQLRVTGEDGVAQVAGESLTVAPSPLALAQAATEAGAAPDAVAEQVEAAQVLAEKPLVTDAETGTTRVLAGAAVDLVIDTLAFAPDDTITLSGRGAPEAALLRAYIDNAEVGLVQAGSTGDWSMRLPAAAAGPHSLRVDALDAAGKVLARAEQAFEGVAPPVLEAALAPMPDLPQASAMLTTAPPQPETVATAAPQPEPAKASAPQSAPASGPPRTRAVTIAAGNTLWAIAGATYGDPYLYVQIFEANRDQIRDPDRIYPGQVFTLPE
ncbi:nucleoid-associated protein YgaU [Rhodobacter aestuarii]|uniref:Nucleoid-associated protein YgaU, contains BON and LysM domains n=2 Tax=Rhodobacter aestuarii TaxID=453582 RepID=A0A1N7J1P7_9RHOB|nr:LysM peptidoglycan-binding domain-containing protein [Rhodobacter aestuarii]PTV97294.1 nucleoid-associated protein YgaU [Rhodobacter aestuarii]SIS43141.1 Nucleoid-associated protein YgaU, contains BON and LysM domains [Rhodobacter aestuarii]